MEQSKISGRLRPCNAKPAQLWRVRLLGHGVLPDRGTDAGAALRLEELNAMLARGARARGIAFVDAARPPIAAPSGALAREMSADDVHLDIDGYRTLARWIIAEGGDAGRLLAP